MMNGNALRMLYIYSVDRRNGRDKVKIRKILYLKKCNDSLKNVEPEVEEITNKRGTTYYAAQHMVSTCTYMCIYANLQQKLLAKYGLHVSFGALYLYKPLFVTYPSEKEKMLCLCIKCLNMQFLLKPINEYLSANGYQQFLSVISPVMDTMNYVAKVHAKHVKII